jgi:zinc transport system permease protein
MIDLTQIFANFFMGRALLTGAVLGAALAYLGIFAILKKMSFFSDGISHASLAGIAFGLILGINPFLTAIIFALILAAVIYFAEKGGRISVDAAIGIIFSIGIALGVLLMNLNVSFQRDLNSFLFGSILAIRQADLLVIVPASLLILIFALLFRKKLTLLSLDYETAYISGINPALFQFIFYLVLAAAVVAGIKLLGIFLVSALIIIPVSSAKQMARSFASLEILTIVFAELAVFIGLVVSYSLDWPTGATVVLVASALFLLASFGGHFIGRRKT